MALELLILSSWVKPEDALRESRNKLGSRTTCSSVEVKSHLPVSGRTTRASRSALFRGSRRSLEIHLARDKGGPSKGGFLNNRLCSYTDPYLCNEMNGMCT